MEAAGHEPPQEISGKDEDSPEGGAKSGAVGARAADSGCADPALVVILDAWPSLPEPLKAGILAMVRVATGRN